MYIYIYIYIYYIHGNIYTIQRHTHTSTHAQSAYKRNGDLQAEEPGWEGRKKGFVRDLVHTQQTRKCQKKPIFTFLKKRFEHIEFPAKLPDYFLRSNKSNINQYTRIYICIYKKRRGKGENVNLISEHRLVSSQLGRAMNWVDRLRTSALSGLRAVVIAWWAVVEFGCFSLTFRFSVNASPWSFLGLEVLRAYLLGLCCTTDFPPTFLQLCTGPLWCCAEILQSYALCSSDQSRTVKLRLFAVRELFWGMLGKGDWGLRGIGVSRSGYNEVLALEVLNVVSLRRT